MDWTDIIGVGTGGGGGGGGGGEGGTRGMCPSQPVQWEGGQCLHSQNHAHPCCTTPDYEISYEIGCLDSIWNVEWWNGGIRGMVVE